MTSLIDALSVGVPAALTQLRTLGRTRKKRADDVLAYFDRPGTSNGPTEAMNGRLEHLRGSALGCRNLTQYQVRDPDRRQARRGSRSWASREEWHRLTAGDSRRRVPDISVVRPL